MIETEPCRHLYIHVPFCAHICGYCDFVHVICRRESVEQWLSAVIKEMEYAHIPDTIETIYIGGGTPTSPDPDQLDALLSAFDPYSRHVKEYTIEIYPETLDETKAKILHWHGINRASIGFQSSDPSLLALMGRKHTMDTMHSCVSLLREEGITNLSVDLMYSLPGQTMAQLRQSVYDALSLHPSHLSLYSLTIEENTVFGKMGYDHLDEEKAIRSMKYPTLPIKAAHRCITSGIGSMMTSLASGQVHPERKTAADMITAVPYLRISKIRVIEK